MRSPSRPRAAAAAVLSAFFGVTSLAAALAATMSACGGDADTSSAPGPNADAAPPDAGDGGSASVSDAGDGSAPGDAGDASPTPTPDGGDRGDASDGDADAGDGTLASAPNVFLIGVTSDNFIVYALTEYGYATVPIYAVPVGGGAPQTLFEAMPNDTFVRGPLVATMTPALTAAPCGGAPLTVWSPKTGVATLSANGADLDSVAPSGTVVSFTAWDSATCDVQLFTADLTSSRVTLVLPESYPKSSFPHVTFADDGSSVALGSTMADGGWAATCRLFAPLAHIASRTYDAPCLLDATGRWIWLMDVAKGGSLRKASDDSVAFSNPQATTMAAFDAHGEHLYYVSGASAAVEQLVVNAASPQAVALGPQGAVAGIALSPIGTSLLYYVATDAGGVSADLTPTTPGAPSAFAFAAPTTYEHDFTVDGRYSLSLGRQANGAGSSGVLTAQSTATLSPAIVSTNVAWFTPTRGSAAVALMQDGSLAVIDPAKNTPPVKIAPAYGTARTSPDGAWIAYTTPASPGSPQRLVVAAVP